MSDDTLHSHSVLCKLLKVLTRRICLTIKRCFSFRSFALFLRLSCLIQDCYCTEKLDASQKVKTLVRRHLPFIHLFTYLIKKICFDIHLSFIACLIFGCFFLSHSLTPILFMNLHKQFSRRYIHLDSRLGQQSLLITFILFYFS